MIRSLLGLVGLLAASAAWAHTGVHAGGGFLAGFTHPFIGLDHLLAMVAVGLWAVQLGGRHLLVVPAAFVSAMAIGASVGAMGVALPQVESMVAVSVLALGALVALSTRAAGYWAVLMVAAFGLFHGHAHGTEMPAFAAPWQYFAGFTIATASLHAIGVTGGMALKNRTGILRAGGVAIGLAGGWLLLALWTG
jgi:urease accessory protein